MGVLEGTCCCSTSFGATFLMILFNSNSFQLKNSAMVRLSTQAVVGWSGLDFIG